MPRNSSQLSPTVSLQITDGIACIEIDNPPVNALSGSVIDGLNLALTQIDNDPALHLAILLCKGRGFIAGADLKEIAATGRNRSNDAAEMINRIARSKKIFVAAIHGNALGGGFETALACDYRCCTSNAFFGLPEVNIGAMPGYGGTQRLPRLIGYKKALEIMLSGNPIAATEAQTIGIVDLVTTGDLFDDTMRFAKKLLNNDAPLRKIDTVAITATANAGTHCDAAFKLAVQSRPGEDAPELIIQSVRDSAKLAIDEGLKQERQLSRSRMQAPQSLAMRHLFFAERAVRKSAELHPYSQKTTDPLPALEPSPKTTNFSLGDQLIQPLLNHIERVLKSGVDPQQLTAAFEHFGWLSLSLQQRIATNESLQISTPGTIEITNDDNPWIQGCTTAMFRAGTHLLTDNPTLTSADLDVISCNGYGFPRFRGGIMYYGKRQGYTLN